MRILGIETSCDETAAALVEVRNTTRGTLVYKGAPCFRVLSNVVASQMSIHEQYGGVVPEVAARNHIIRILPVIQQALKKINHQSTIINHTSLDLIAVTAGPGLMTSLAVGVETARYLGYAWKVPVVATNHLAGHLYSSLLSNSRDPSSVIQRTGLRMLFPALGLIVSGGHTELVLMKGYGQHTLIGETLDDAAGEAFDKIAKLLGLPYPGGPHLAALAEKGNPKAYDFPRSMMKSGDFNFSFSGLKTSVFYFLKKCQMSNVKCQVFDICASVQAAIVDVLVAKTVAAAKKYRVKTVLLGGGVAANKFLRAELKRTLKNELPNTYHLSPITSYCTDNAAMIGAAGYIAYRTKTRQHPLAVDPHWRIG